MTKIHFVGQTVHDIVLDVLEVTVVEYQQVS